MRSSSAPGGACGGRVAGLSRVVMASADPDVPDAPGHSGGSVKADRATLERRLLSAHEEGGAARLSRLYDEASRMAEGDGDRERAAFFLTHAWVYALEAGDPVADDLCDRLRLWGRCA